MWNLLHQHCWHIGAGGIGAPIVVAAGGICAPIYWRTDVPLRQQAMFTKHGKPIMFCGFFFMFGPPFLLAAGGIGAPIVLADYKEDDCVRPPHLFSYQSPINWALQTGNGNTLKKRRRLHKKINRHRSPQSGTTFEHLPASRPQSFFIGHYL